MTADFASWFLAEKGGPGSGNFNHSGRPGKVGGSASSSGGGAVSVMDRWLRDDGYVAGRKLTKQELAEIKGVYGKKPPEFSDKQGDLVLREIARKQGFDGLPQEMNQLDYEDAVKAGDLIGTYRGVRAWDIQEVKGYVEQYKSGEVYYGAGILGNGVYTSDVKGIAKEYSYWQQQGDACIIQIGIRKDARIITSDELADYMFDEKNQASIARDFGDDWFNWFDDAGKIAMALGYDVITKDMSHDFQDLNKPVNYYVILNRTATVIIR